MAQKVRGTSIDCYYGNIKNKSENKQFRLILDCLIEKGSATIGRELGDIFTEALGEVKIEKEAKRLKAENKNIDELSCDEFKKRYGKWTKYELECLRVKLEEGKNNG